MRITQIWKKMKENKKRVYVAFMDLEKAYDRVDRDATVRLSPKEIN